MPRPKSYPADLRERLVAAAAERLADRGPQDLSLRTLAASQDTSTNAIYSLFGGKDGLIGAVLVEASQSFMAAQHAALGAGDSADDLVNLGLAYRSWALDHPALYRVMMGSTTIPLGGPELGSADPLRAAVTNLVAAGRLRAVEVAPTCRSLWASVHGWVLLEIAQASAPLDPLGSREQADERFRVHLIGTLAGFASEAERARLV